MNFWHPDVPPVLYKYLKPDRLDVLTNGRIRFSPRSAFSDDHELQPDYDSYGTIDEIKRQLQSVNSGCPAWMPIGELARLIADDPKHQATALKIAVNNIPSLDSMGILCLTVTARSEQMWDEYAQGGAGFVVAFDTTHAGFLRMTAPRGVGRVTYSSKGIPTFLGMMEKDPYAPLFRKRIEYAYEQEWRSLRLFKDLERHPTRSNEIFLAEVDPASIVEIVIRPRCTVEAQIREIINRDARYRGYRVSIARIE